VIPFRGMNLSAPLQAVKRLQVVTLTLRLEETTLYCSPEREKHLSTSHVAGKAYY